MSISIFPPRPFFTLVSYDGHNAILRRCRMVSTVPPCFFHTAFIHLPYCCHTAAILLPYRCHTASILFSCLSYNVNSGRNAPYRCLCTHPNACAQKRSAKAITARNAVEVVSEYHRIMLIARISSGHAARPGLPRRAPAYLPPDSI